MKPKIIDNFLDEGEFSKIQEQIMGEHWPWFFNGYVEFPREDRLEYKGRFHFIHVLYGEGVPRSENMNIIFPIINKLNPTSLYRIKANLSTRTPEIIKGAYHIDVDSEQMTTSLFYMNTSNGYSEFKDGTIVESVANRMVIFPANLYHRGTSCSDQQTRVVINFNYFSVEDADGKLINMAGF